MILLDMKLMQLSLDGYLSFGRGISFLWKGTRAISRILRSGIVKGELTLPGLAGDYDPRMNHLT